MKSGFVSIIGRPNVGKSTLLNRIMGEKLSIISNKPQTTRNRISLIYSEEDLQVVFLDTPGVQKPANKLGEYMLGVSKDSLKDVDVITVIVDSGRPGGKLDQFLFDMLKDMNLSAPKILLINKIDRVSKEDLLPLLSYYGDTGLFQEIIPVSAIKGENVEDYLKVLKDLLPEGPQYYPDDMITDQPEKFIVGELIREQALRRLNEEVPHGVAVVIESMKERTDKRLMDIQATITVERDSHKGIIIGKQGRMLKDIGTDARQEIQRLLDIPVNLQLWVKVKKNWRDQEESLKRFGYR